jgi:hypothetical protein
MGTLGVDHDTDIDVAPSRWKAPSNPFRGEPWHVKSIPTIIKVRDVRLAPFPRLGHWPIGAVNNGWDWR